MMRFIRSAALGVALGATIAVAGSLAVAPAAEATPAAAVVQAATGIQHPGGVEHVKVPYAPMTLEQQRGAVADMNLGPQKLAERDAALAQSKACANWKFSLFAVFTGYNATGPHMGIDFTYCGQCVGSLSQMSYGRPIAENPVSSGTAASWVEYGRSGYTNAAMNCYRTIVYYYGDWVAGSYYEQFTGAGYWNVPNVSRGNRMWRINAY